MIVGGYDVPILNATSAYVSDAGHIMSIDEPFAACYWDHPDGRSFSLRSSKNGIDVAKVAKNTAVVVIKTQRDSLYRMVGKAIK